MSGCRVKTCAVVGCGTRIGLMGSYCTEHEYAAGNISGPCSVCGSTVTGRARPTDLICGPACRGVKDRRDAAAYTAKPGDDWYSPVNDEQRGLHRQALRKRGDRYGTS